MQEHTAQTLFFSHVRSPSGLGRIYTYLALPISFPCSPQSLASSRVRSWPFLLDFHLRLQEPIATLVATLLPRGQHVPLKRRKTHGKPKLILCHIDTGREKESKYCEK